MLNEYAKLIFKYIKYSINELEWQQMKLGDPFYVTNHLPSPLQLNMKIVKCGWDSDTHSNYIARVYIDDVHVCGISGRKNILADGFDDGVAGPVRTAKVQETIGILKTFGDLH